MTYNELIHPLSMWDYVVIVFYLGFVSSIGFICKKVNKNVNDYFRGGGNMMWWVGGVSALMAGLSTWSFTGAAAKCYKDGIALPLAYWFASIPTLIILLMLAPRFRRTRVITSMEAVYRRFGFNTEQFYTWISLILGIFLGGVGLNTLGVFISSSFQTDLFSTIIVLGIIMTILSALGGQWGVSLGAFVQGLLMFLIVFTVVIFSVNLPEIGGVTNFFKKMPDHHTDFSVGATPQIVWLWIAWSTLSTTINYLDLRNCSKYVRVKDDKNAKWMVWVIMGPNLFFALAFLIQIPPICAAIIFPDLGHFFPHLKNPEEAAWVAMAFKVLPQGLLGLLVCGMFSAAIDSLDTALNSNAGIFVRNVYARYIHKNATDLEQLRIGKVVTISFGLLMIVVGITINNMRSINFFDFFQLFNSLVTAPLGVPMILGIFIKRTPSWSGWSTVLVGIISSILAKIIYQPSLFEALFNLQTPLNPREILDTEFVFISVISLSIATGWFLATTFFYKSSPLEDQSRVEKLFEDLDRPIDRVAEGGEDQDAMQYKIVGSLCMILGGFLFLCVLIPNPAKGRLTFLAIAGIISLIGYFFYRLYLKKNQSASD